MYFVRLVSDDSPVALFFDREVAEHYVMHQFTFMEDLKITPVVQCEFCSPDE